MSTCEKCQHWCFVRQGNVKRAGTCRRNAPRPVEGGGPVIETQWPITLEDDGCSEFAAVEGKVAAVEEPFANVPAAGDGVRSPRKTAKGGKARKTR